MSDTETFHSKLEKTSRTKIKRFAQRGNYERETINNILDSLLICHVAFTHNGLPALLPMAFWRDENFVYFHGSAQNRMFGALTSGGSCCLVADSLDALVLSRSAMHHSVNYRSVVIYGVPESVTGSTEKLQALETFIGKIYPGRWQEIKQPDQSELDAILIFKLPILEASAKIRAEQPTRYPGDVDDSQVSVWTGLVPIHTSLGMPVSDRPAELPLPIPAHARHFSTHWPHPVSIPVPTQQ